MSQANRSATQANRQVQVGSPVGDKLLFHRMVATEAMSDLYEIELDLLSHDVAIDPDQILGGQFTVAWKWDPDGDTRTFTGICIRFGMTGGRGGLAEYRAVLAPPLWLMAQNRNSRIFHNMSVKDIVQTMLDQSGLSAETLEGMDAQLEYCVQYEESDYAFICRLMERYGSYFYHEHTADGTKLHIVKAGHSHADLPWHQPVLVREPGAADRQNIEHFDDWAVEGRVRPDTATYQDYDFLQPRADLEGSKTVEGWSGVRGLEIYEFQTGHTSAADGAKLAEHRALAAQADSHVYRGSGDARALSPGYTFSVTGDRAAVVGETDQLAVRTVSRLVEEGYETGMSGAECLFEVAVISVPASIKWQAPRRTPQPRIYGPQSAVVVNENNEELDVDRHGRVCVQFNWEREGQASMRVRVSQMWAGAQWGAVAWPRRGQEVIVEHLNGDPDRPIITGRVFNDSAMPTHDPEKDASIFSIKSRSTPGGAGFNALEFQDKSGEEYVFLHSQKDSHIRTTESHFELIGKDEHAVVKGDSKREIEGDLHDTIKGDEKRTIKGTHNLKITSDHLVKAANIVEKGDQNVHIKGGMNVVIEAGMKLSLKVGGSFVVIDSSGVSISGPMVKVNSGGAAGSGAGTAPAAAAPPDEPMEGEPGAEAPEARGRDWAAAKKRIANNPAAAVMLKAAASGAPFCEMCERARKEEEAKKQNA